MVEEIPVTPQHHETEDTESGENIADHQQSEGQSLLTQLFGARKYQYRLELKE
jgi:hypothetical protein